MNGADEVQGEMQRDSGMVTGWCWLPSRPRERLRVALLVDGHRQGATTAARLRLDLVRDGVRDGYQGFSLPLPDPLPTDARLEAQELGTGRVFARLLSPLMPCASGWNNQLNGLERHLKALQVKPALTSTCDSKLAAVMAGASALSGAKWSVGRNAHLAFPLTGLELWPTEQPQVSLLLDAVPDGVGAIAAIKAVIPLLRQFRAELLVVDDGASGASADLAALCGLQLMRRRQATATGRIDTLLRIARAERLCVLYPAPLHTVSLARLLYYASEVPNAVLLGSSWGDVGLCMSPAALLRSLPQPGARVVAPRTVLTGGLDAAVVDHAGGLERELGLRARAMKLAVHTWSDPAVAH